MPRNPAKPIKAKPNTSRKRTTKPKPTEPTKPKLKKPVTQPKPIKLSNKSLRDEPDLAPPIIEGPQGVWNEAFKHLIPSTVTMFEILSSTRLENLKYEMKTYRVMCGYQGNETKRATCDVAMLVLYPGTPKDQAEKALKLMLEELPESPPKEGPLSYNLTLHMKIRFYLLKFIKDPEGYIKRLLRLKDPPIMLPRNKKISGTAYCQAVATQFGISKSVVKRAYSKLKIEQGHQKKSYEIYPEKRHHKD